VDLEPLAESEDVALVLRLIQRHVRFTNSKLAARVLESWESVAPAFIKVLPRDYKRVRLAVSKAREENREPVFAELVGAIGG
jgi:glutamate synthase domain-containing protein 3